MSAKPVNGQYTAKIDGDFVVFLIGMRINKPWKVSKWLPALRGMKPMIDELKAAGPESGFLGHTPISLGVIAQYWRSFEHLEAYARSKDHLHWPAWVDFNKRMKGTRDDVGIWHETYQVRAGEYEAVYSGMPPFGLAAASEMVPIGKQAGSSARERLSGAL